MSKQIEFVAACPSCMKIDYTNLPDVLICRGCGVWLISFENGVFMSGHTAWTVPDLDSPTFHRVIVEPLEPAA